MVIKRIFAMLMAFALVLGGIPAAGLQSMLSLQVQAAADTDYTWDSGTKTMAIKTEAGWKHFADVCFPANKGMAEWKVILENNIELAAGEIPSVDDFQGSFDGKGHYIKIKNGDSYFSKGSDSRNMGADVGLFRNLIGKAKVQNLILWLEGGKLSATTATTEAITSYGALVGRMSTNAILQNCALVGSGTIEHERTGSNGSYVSQDGSMVGRMENSSKIDGCYSELSMNITFNPTTNESATAIVGGIVGVADSANCIVSNTAYLGERISINATYRFGSAPTMGGGIIGYMGSMSNCFVKGTKIVAGEINGIRLRGCFGHIAGKDLSSQVTNSFSNASLDYEPAYAQNNQGYYQNIDGVDASMMGNAWVDTIEGFPSLKWLVTQAPAVTVNSVDSANAIGMTPPYVEYGGDKKYDKDTDSLWMFDASIPIKGRAAPMTSDVTLKKLSGGGAMITKVEVSDNTINPPSGYYSGLTYPFLATVSGKGVEGNISEKNLTWAAIGHHSSSMTIDTSSWWQGKGKLKIPDDFYGTVDLTAAYGGVTSAIKTLKVNRGTLSLADKTVLPNTKVPMELSVTGGDEVLKGINLASVKWTLGNSSTGFTLDNGVLTVGENATGSVKVTAAVPGMVAVTATMTVGAAGTENVSADLKSAASDTTVTVEKTLALGNSVTMTVVPHDVVSGEDSSITWKGDGTTSTDTGESFTYKPTTAGTKTFTATQAINKTAEPPTKSTYTASFNITVTDSDTAVNLKKTTASSPTPWELYEIKGKNDDSGGGSTSTYSIALPAAIDGMTYYYKLVDSKFQLVDLDKIYTSTVKLAEDSYQICTSDIKLNIASNEFVAKHLLVVALDKDGGAKLPSSVTHFKLPDTLPSLAEEKIKCANTTAAGAAPPSIGKMTNGYYTVSMLSTDSPGSPTWETILKGTSTADKLVSPQSVDYIATGEIKITVWPTKDRFGNSLINNKISRFVAIASGEVTKGDIAPKPTIYPRETGIITDGVTIKVPDGATVLYTATPGVISPEIPQVNPDNGKPLNPKTKTYVAGERISFPSGTTSFVVCAVAWISGKSLSEVDYVLYKNTDNLLTPEAPTLLLNGVRYSSESTYPNDSKIVFEHQDLGGENEILFTVNGEEPVDGRYNTKIFKASKGDGIVSFDPTKPYPLNGISELVSIRAKFHDKNKGLYSPTVDYRIFIKQKLSAPVANLEADAMVRPGAKLKLSLSDLAIKQLNTNGKVFVERLPYSADMDTKSEFPEATTITVDGDVPIPNVEYVSYRVNNDSQAYTLPVIRYLFGEDKTKVATNGIVYKYGQRRVLSTSKTTTDASGVSTVETTVTITYTNPQDISLTGAAGQQVKVNTMAISGLEARSDSDVVTFGYTIRSAVAKPVAFPETKPNKPAPINVGERIALSSETSDALIFYTLDGSEPKVEYVSPTPPATVGTWKALDKSTMLYNETDSIKMESNAQLLFTIRAIAVSKNFSLESSPSTLFLYQPPAPVPPVFASPIQGAVVVNQGITLQCAMDGARIFYKTFTSPPDITSAQGKLDNIPQPNRDQIFDPKAPITITKPTWIVAIAEKSGAISSPTVNAYTVAAQISDPTSSLKTGSVVYKGTRIRLSAEGNLAFTLDGSDPKIALAAQSAAPTEKDAKKAEVLYGDSVVIDAEYGKSVTVRAFAYSEGRSPSNTVSFTYTVCEKDAYLVVSPTAETVVTEGDNITMTTGISNGMVFYSVDSKTPTLINRFDDDHYNDNWEDEDWDYDYTHYQWRNGSGTRKGNSVRVTGAPGETFTLKATAVANGSEGGTVSVFNYRIRSRTSAPTASIPSGAVVFDDATVTLTAQEGDIFYTTDGTEPSTSSRIYLEPIKVTGSMVLKAIAVAKDKVPSNAVEYIYSYANQAFAPSMGLPSGEIEQGSRITLSSQTQDAIIYYTTNGVDPTEDSILYSSPITIMRPVTIKAIAIRKDMRDSAVNTATYTVIEPEPPEPDEPNGTGKPQGPLDSLVSRRTYFDANAGPKFSDVIIQDPQTNAVLSTNNGNVPKRAQLVVKQIDSSDSDKEAVRSAVGYQIVTLYDVSLEQDGEKIQPTGEVEIGIPIPNEYQNGVVTICRVGADNTVEEYKPRRSGSNAYITVEGNLDRYAVTVPDTGANRSNRLADWQIALICAVCILLTLGGVLLAFYLFRKNRKISDVPVSPTDFGNFTGLGSSDGFENTDNLENSIFADSTDDDDSLSDSQKSDDSNTFSGSNN